MRKTIITCILIFYSGFTIAQIVKSNESGAKVFYPDTTEACDPSSIFLIVEVMPEYEGGLEKLEQDLNEKLSFDKKINSKIYISIHINCNDKAYGFQVLKGIDPNTDNKLVNELAKLQNWNSGIQRNKNVDCLMNMGFKLKNGRLEITN